MTCHHSKIADCPLYVLSHDPRFTGYGCVGDMAEPCKASSPDRYQRMLGKAVKAAFSMARVSVKARGA